MNKLQDFLCAKQGSCSVILHIELPQQDYTVRANPLTKVPHTDEFIEELETYRNIESVWRE